MSQPLIDTSVLNYKEPTPAEDPTTRLETVWGNLPNSRWKSVGRMIQLKVVDDATALTTGDSKAVFMIPTELDGTHLVRAVGFVSTVSASGGPVDVQIRNITQTTDCLSTSLKIDDSEYTSLTAATPVVIKATVIFRPGDLIAIDVDDAGSGAKGLGVQMSFQ